MNDMDVIFSYSWDDAIADGVFVRADDKLRKEAGIKFPVAITSNLYHTYIRSGDSDVDGRTWDLLWMFRLACANLAKFGTDWNEVDFKVQFGNEEVNVIGVCEARNPDNPEPIITLMLPEDR